MPTLKLTCPNSSCGRTLSVPQERLGRKARCPSCRTAMLLTADGAVSLPAGSSSGQTVELANQSTLSPEKKRKSAASNSKPPARIGRFHIQNKLGMGGFGIVYRALDTTLEREVALKVPHAALVEDDKAARRFLREAKAAARLTHPNIVQVFDAGRADGRYFIASSFVEGTSLDQVIKQRGPLPPKEAAEIVRALAEALHYAHSKGIVHRDIKPHNVLVDEFGEPHLMDFGLAQLETEREKLTRDGAVIGTPAYMPPEQASSKTADQVGPLSDQYSLGAVLYELLTGEAPFSGPVPVVIANVLTREPDAVRSLNTDVPRDLETICAKAMAKEAAGRFLDCDAFANDLEAWLTGRPITARRVGAIERTARWVKRNPLIGGLTVGVLAVSVIGFLTSSFFLTRSVIQERRAIEAAEAAKQQEKLAHKSALLSKRALYDAQIRVSQDAYRLGDIDEARLFLNDTSTTHREWAYHYLNNLLHSDLVNTTGTHPLMISSHVSAGINNEQITLYNDLFGNKIDTMPIGEMTIGHSAYSPLSRLFLYTEKSRGGSSTLHAWSLDAHAQQWSTSIPANITNMLACPNSGTIALATSPNQGQKHISLIEGISGNLLATTTIEDTHYFSSLSFADHGTKLLVESAGNSRGLHVFSAITLKEETFLRLNDSLGCIAAEPGTTRFILVLNGKVTLWDCEQMEQLEILGDLGYSPTCAAFSPDGRHLAIGGDSLTIFDLKNKTHDTHTDHTFSISQVAFSLDGKSIGSFDGEDIYRLSLRTQTNSPLSQSSFSVPTGSGPIREIYYSASFSKDGRFMAAGTRSGDVILWDLDKGAVISRIETGAQHSIVRLWTNDDCSLVGWTHAGSELHIWHPPEDNVIRIGEAYPRAISSDLSHALYCSGSKISLKEVGDNRVRDLWEIPFPEKLRTASISQSGELTALVARTSIAVIDRSGRQFCSLQIADSNLYLDMAFSNTGEFLAGATSSGLLTIWDIRTSEELWSHQAHRTPFKMAFLPSQDSLITYVSHLSPGKTDERAKLWGATSGICYLSLPNPAPIRTIGFGDNGSSILMFDWAGKIERYNGAGFVPTRDG